MRSTSTYIVAGIVIVAFSFVATMYVLNLLSGYPVAQPPSAASAPSTPSAKAGDTKISSIDDLPRIEGAGVQWAGLALLNVQADTGASVVTGQPILRLIPTSDDGYHTLAEQIGGFGKNQIYRITAWVKPVAGGSVELAVNDKPNGQPGNYATGIFDLTGHAVLSGNGAAKDRGIEQGPGNWQKVWLDLKTLDGQFVVAIRPVSGGNSYFKGDGSLGVIFGGVEAIPQG